MMETPGHNSCGLSYRAPGIKKCITTIFFYLFRQVELICSVGGGGRAF